MRRVAIGARLADNVFMFKRKSWLFVFLFGFSLFSWLYTPALVDVPVDAPVYAQEEDGNAEKSCEEAAGWEMGWAICPIVRGVAAFIDNLVGSIVNFLNIANVYEELEDASDQIRNVARGLYSLALITVIYSLATGSVLSAFDARRMATRLFVAILMVELAFSGLGFLIEATTDIAKGIPELVEIENKDTFGLDDEAGNEALDLITEVGVEAGQFLLGLAAVAAALLGLLAASMGLLMLWIVVLLRNFLLLTLLALAPFALVFYALPFGEKIPKLWWSFFNKALFLYPALVFALVMGKFISTIITQAYSDAAGSSPLTKIIVHVTGLLLTFGAPLFVVWAIRQAGGLVGQLTGVLDKNRERFNPAKKLLGSRFVRDNMNRARKGSLGGETTRRAKVAQALTNPLAALAGTRLAGSTNLTRRATAQAAADANHANTQLMGEFAKQIEDRGVIGDSYRDAQLAQTLYHLQNHGTDEQQAQARQIMSHLSDSNPTLYANLQRNMDYLNGSPEAALAHFQTLAGMGKLTTAGESFGVRGLEGMHIDGLVEGGKLKIGEGMETADIALQYMQDKKFEEGTIGVAIQGLGNASYKAGQQINKYLTAYDEEGNFTGKVDRNIRKSMEKSGARFWTGNKASVAAGADELVDWVNESQDDYIKAQHAAAAAGSGPGAATAQQNLRNAEVNFRNTMQILASAEQYLPQMEQANRNKVQATIDKLTVGDDARSQQKAVFYDAAREQNRVIGGDDALARAQARAAGASSERGGGSDDDAAAAEAARAGFEGGFDDIGGGL